MGVVLDDDPSSAFIALSQARTISQSDPCLDLHNDTVFSMLVAISFDGSLDPPAMGSKAILNILLGIFEDTFGLLGAVSHNFCFSGSSIAKPSGSVQRIALCLCQMVYA
jgi:hypothetical protein